MKHVILFYVITVYANLEGIDGLGDLEVIILTIVMSLAGRLIDYLDRKFSNKIDKG